MTYTPYLLPKKGGGVVCLLANTKAKLKRQRLVRKKRDVNQKLYNLGEWQTPCLKDHLFSKTYTKI